VSLRKKGITHIVRNAPEIAMEVIQMYSKLSTRLSRRRSDRTKIILLAAIFLIVVPNYLTGVARASAGDLVSGFGSGGKVITDFSGIDVAAAVAVYPRFFFRAGRRGHHRFLQHYGIRSRYGHHT